MSYHRSFNLPVTILRPFNTFGPRQSMRAVIPTIIGQFLTSKKITIGNLTPTRDFTFVKDTVEAFTKSLKAKDIIGETINIGSNFEVSIKEIIEMVSIITNRKIEIKSDKKELDQDQAKLKD